MTDLVYTSGEGWVSVVESPTKDSAMMVLRPAMVGDAGGFRRFGANVELCVMLLAREQKQKCTIG